MAKRYKLQAEEYISPKNEELPLIIKVLGAKSYKKEFAHYLPQVGYQDCTVQFVERKKKTGTCPHCDAGIKSRARFIWDLLAKRGNEWKPVLIRMNTTSHRKLEEVLAALSLTGRAFEDSALALTIGTDKKHGYKFYQFKLHQDEQPPSSQPLEPNKDSAFGADNVELAPEEESGVMTATDEMVLAKNAKHIFDPNRDWNKTTLTKAFHMELKANDVDDEKHALEVAEYVLENFEELKAKYSNE